MSDKRSKKELLRLIKTLAATNTRLGDQIESQSELLDSQRAMLLKYGEKAKEATKAIAGLRLAFCKARAIAHSLIESTLNNMITIEHDPDYSATRTEIWKWEGDQDA